MKTINWKLAAVTALGLSLTAGLALAEPAERPQKPRGEKAAQHEGQKKGPKAQGEKAEGDKAGERGQRAQRGMALLFKDIQLSDEQKKQVREVMVESRQAIETWREANAEQIESIRAEMQSAREAQNREQVQAAAGKLRELMQTRPDTMESTAEKLRLLLDEAQQKQFDANLIALQERMQERMQNGRGEGGKAERPGKAGGKPEAGEKKRERRKERKQDDAGNADAGDDA